MSESKREMGDEDNEEQLQLMHTEGQEHLDIPTQKADNEDVTRWTKPRRLSTAICFSALAITGTITTICCIWHHYIATAKEPSSSLTTNAELYSSMLLPIKEARISDKTLEFIHIPKTGGSAIEAAGGSGGILWGSCHYHLTKAGDAKSWCSPNNNPLPHPKSNATGVPLQRTAPWHIPPKHYVPYPFRSPQENTTYFAVVRNPYDRMVSEFYCPYTGFNSQGAKKERYHKDGPATVQDLNTWIQTLIRDGCDHFRQGWSRSMHYIPQHVYIYRDNGTQIVDHVLRFENLRVEFDFLMTMYDLSETVILPAKRGEHAVNVAKFKGTTKLTTEDLSKESVKRINECYREDFERFGYEMRDPETFHSEDSER